MVFVRPNNLIFKVWLSMEAVDFGTTCLIVFGVVLFFAVLLTSSCSVLLELLYQQESGENISLSNAFSEYISKNLIKTLPIAISWAFIWFGLLLLQALFSKSKKNSGEDDTLTAENAARTLAGFQSFSLSKAFFQALQKNVRLVVFLILPAIAWDNLGPREAVKKGFLILKTNITGFLTGYVLTEAVSVVIFFPIALLLGYVAESDIQLPTIAWTIVFIYIAFAWSFSFYVEQMYTAELYMWHMRWEEAVERAHREGKEIPSIDQIVRPSVLDEFADFEFKADIDNLPRKKL